MCISTILYIYGLFPGEGPFFKKIPREGPRKNSHERVQNAEYSHERARNAEYSHERVQQRGAHTAEIQVHISTEVCTICTQYYLYRYVVQPTITLAPGNISGVTHQHGVKLRTQILCARLCRSLAPLHGPGLLSHAPQSPSSAPEHPPRATLFCLPRCAAPQRLPATSQA